MKYIKAFEKYIKYSEGEYVSLGDSIIARINKYGNFGGEIQYYVEILDKENYTFFNNHWVDEDDIERYLNSEEKEIVKFATDKIKFNL